MPHRSPVRSIPLTRSIVLAPFVAFLDQGGASTRRHLRDTRIDPEILRSPESFLALQQAAWFVERAGRREGVEDFGLQVGAASSILDLGLFGDVLARSLTLRDVVLKLIRWAPILNSGLEVSAVNCDEDTVEVRLRERIENSRQHADDFCLMLLLDAIRLALGSEWRPREVKLSEQSFRFSGRYEIFSEARCLPSFEYMSVRLPKVALNEPLPARLRATSGDPEQSLQQTSPTTDFAASLAQVVESMIGVEPPTIETSAEIATISVRTLQRRLAARATTFEEVVDRVRFEKAIDLMAQPDHKLDHIAARLGYSDLPNFSRAFRRWTGVAPGHFRKTRWAIG